MGVAAMSVRKREWKTSKGVEREGWAADYRDQQGNRVVKLFATKKEAAAYHAKVATEVNAGIHTVPSRSITVREAAEDWIQFIAGEGRERSTLDVYKQHVRLHVLPRIGALRLGHLTTPRVNKFRDGLLADGMTRITAKKVLGTLKGILKDAKRRGNVAQNVASDVSVIIDKRHKVRLKVGEHIPTRDEIKAIVDKLEGRWRPFFLVAIFTGLRASELRGLRWKDIDLREAVVHVRQRADRWGTIGNPKSHAGERTVPIPPLVLNALREWKLRCPKSDGDLAFPTNRTGKPLVHANIVTREFMPVQVAAGVTTKDGKPKYPGLHSLRHFYASLCINRRVDGGLELPLKVVQARLGHSSITMTADTYGHLFPSADDGAELAALERDLLGLHVTQT
jgi:integrase